MTYSFACLVFIGRFQPFHNGHLALLRRALREAATVVVVIGSAKRARNVDHPFSDAERVAMIDAAVRALDPDGAGRVVYFPVRDRCDDGHWAAAVRCALRVVCAGGGICGIVGHETDASTGYLRAFPEWDRVLVENWGGIRAAELRRLFFQGVADEKLAAVVPPEVLEFLRGFRSSPAHGSLVEEFAAVDAGRAAWSVAPYPPIFVTVDAVVHCRGRVLMIRRGGFPGKGQWALPGGFVEPGERLADAAIRELAEETCVALDAVVLRRALRGVQVFDDPERSVRGRTITHAFHFDLGEAPLPTVSGADDAAEARWVPVTELAAMSGEIFEDHLDIIDRFMVVDGLDDMICVDH